MTERIEVAGGIKFHQLESGVKWWETAPGDQRYRQIWEYREGGGGDGATVCLAKEGGAATVFALTWDAGGERRDAILEYRRGRLVRSTLGEAANNGDIKSGFDRENYERLLGTILEVMPAEEKAILVNGAEKER